MPRVFISIIEPRLLDLLFNSGFYENHTFFIILQNEIQLM